MMREVMTVMAAAAVVLLAAVNVPAQLNPGDREHPRDLAPIPDTGLGPPKFPVPPPEPPVPSGFNGFQLVGFSTELVAGDRGVLNMNRACREVHAGSRMCSVQEINQTIDVPEPGNVGFAWVQSGRPFVAVYDCRGWTSSSAEDRALSIELGPRSGCYGGYKGVSCDQQLAVACCAIVLTAE